MESLKKCRYCEEIKPLSSFAKHKTLEDGHHNKCKTCAAIDEKKRRHGPKRQTILEHDRARGGGRYKVGATEYYRTSPVVKACRKRYMEKNHHRWKLRYAIKTGKIRRVPCEFCGSPISQAHHEDYSKPLEVWFLCQKHHIARHKFLKG